MDRAVPVKDAARLTGVGKSTIYTYVRKGAVQAYDSRGGRLRVVPRDCLPQPRAPRPAGPRKD